MRTSNLLRRVVAAGATAAGVVVLTAVPAAAHVSVSSPDAAPGDYGKLVFRVPNESDTASTTKLEVTLPSDTPFASVSAKTMPGWTIETETTKFDRPVEVSGANLTEAVTRVTWTAGQGNAIPPGQFDEFELSVGPFPEGVETLTLPATQTYSDGEVVAWEQVAKEGAAEPEHPAPVLEMSAAADTGAVAPAAATSDSAAAGGGSADSAEGTDGVARALGGIAVVLAAGALLWSLLSGRRARSGS